ncbi:MAG TPA: MetQ/NlpA family ABC transporter substrate-binding protein [Oscillospiraceae bacterium]|nr:MetQ/NlpA family ABC transporter substrate-binding protein [Oscillospiraceae bacterium]
MKKRILSAILAFALIFAAAALSACGSAPAAATAAPTAAAGDKTITVGASATPHAEILEQVKDALAAEGYTLNIVTYDDYVLPNKALADGEIDANYFQHQPYLDSYNKENGTTLVSAAKIHYEPFGIYGNGITDLKKLAVGATVIIPADDSNETRALLLLRQEGLIALNDGITAATGATTLDIKDDGGYNIQTVQADTVAAQLKNSNAGSIAVINGNYALAAGLKIADALATEDASGDAAQTYANIIAVRSGDENSPKIQALVKALKTDAVRDYINKTYNGAVVALF